MRAWFTFRRLLMLAGFLAAGAGDWFLVVRRAARGSSDFLCGVLCFSLAQILWTAAQAREARPNLRVAVALGVPLALFASVRLVQVLPPATGLAVWAYAILTAVSFSVAYGTRRLFYAGGIGLLLVSDLMIGGALLRAPGCGFLSGPIYLLAEICLLISFVAPREARFDPSRRNVWPTAVLYGAAAFTAFLLAAVCYPGGDYNPLMKMLSALGRTVVRGVAWPLCHYLFMLGLLLATLATAHVWACLVRRGTVGWRVAVLSWGAALNVSGLGAILLVPEDANMTFHNVGCHLAAFGGAGVLFACDRPGRDRAWTCALLGIVSFFGLCLLLHGAGIVPFAPWVTTTQKVLIVSFALWTADLARRLRAAPLRRRHKVALVALMALATAVLATGTTGIAPVATSPAPRSEQCSCATGTTVIPLARDVWAYSMSRNYWGRKPWAPDPCFRENVMYTGHLLQLLALYETFTGDARYWKEGFEFVWDARKRVRYDMRKLIDVTVWQMRNGPNGGVTCEPNLMFFPCNNHPHVALALFARLGHGDWTKDAHRWEAWALAHYADPLLDVGREWRVGSTANWIISRAEANGARFRALLGK